MNEKNNKIFSFISGKSLIEGEWQGGQGTVFSSYIPLKNKNNKRL